MGTAASGGGYEVKFRVAVVLVNVIAFIVVQSLFYILFAQYQAEHFLVSRLQPLANTLEVPLGCDPQGSSSADDDPDADGPLENPFGTDNAKLVYVATYLPLVVLFGVLFSVLPQIKMGEFLRANALIGLSYFSEIVLFVLYFRDYPHLTDGEIAATALESMNVHQKKALAKWITLYRSSTIHDA